MPLTNWFKKDAAHTQDSTNAPQPAAPTAADTTAPAIPGISAGLSKGVGQSYDNWGHQICAAANGVQTTLIPYLQCAYNYSYNEQANDVSKQQEMQSQVKAQIDTENINLDSVQQSIKKVKSDIDQKQKERNDLLQKDYSPNKEARIKLIISSIIIAILTIYLFLFYSSTFYSAFFKDFEESGSSLFQAMFDPRAIPASFSASFFQGMFVLSAPIIFLGLGFALHYFSKQQGIGKYIKCGAMVLVTFCFDCILAYKIGKNLYELDRISGAIPLDAPPYSVGEAISDPNIWAVIFCGFVVYIIWGIVFDLAMDAYNCLDANKMEIKALDAKISELTNNLNTLIPQEATIKKKISDLQNRLTRSVQINYQSIITDVTAFLSGWVQCMAILGLPLTAQNEAQTIGMNYIATIKKIND